MRYVIDYTVSGSGQFPIDMLRYDRSFPADEIESGKIMDTFTKWGEYKIRLLMYTRTKNEQPIEARWRSFCWKLQINDRTPLP